MMNSYINKIEYSTPETKVLVVDLEGVLCESKVGARNEGYTQGDIIDL